MTSTNSGSSIFKSKGFVLELTIGSLSAKIAVGAVDACGTAFSSKSPEICLFSSLDRGLMLERFTK